MKIRTGGPRDVAAVLGMFDSAVAWLVAQGRTGQWGSEPFTGNPQRHAQVREWAEGGGMRIAEVDGQPAGCVVVGPPHPYVDPAPEPELYVRGLVIDRRFSGHGVGEALLDWSLSEARERKVRLLRVDCYAGDDGRLIGYYERWGFTREKPISVGAWPGMVLRREVA
ncbi:GNAT family N-acetyltransferase [Nonomuraea endophytica]|uniref:GNAT family N-acetyltransferase n=1 Tax=Nonomuraea endophytica TaxID=714136 RepID=UPI0037CBB210